MRESYGLIRTCHASADPLETWLTSMYKAVCIADDIVQTEAIYRPSTGGTSDPDIVLGPLTARGLPMPGSVSKEEQKTRIGILPALRPP